MANRSAVRRAALAALLITAAGATRAAGIVVHSPSVVEGIAVFGSRIVWTDARNGHNDVFALDLATGTTTTVATSTGDQTRPAIWGDRIVWVDLRNAKKEVFAYDLATSTERQLSPSSLDQDFPSIWQDVVVWTEGRRTKLYSFTTDTVTDVPTPDPLDQDLRAIVRDGRVVMHRYPRGSGDYDLVAYDLTSGALTNLTSALPEPSYADLGSLDGDRFVYRAVAGATNSIRLYDFTTGLTTTLVERTAVNLVGPVVWKDRVVWVERSFYSTYDDVVILDLSSGISAYLEPQLGAYTARDLDVSGGKIVWIFRDSFVWLHDLLVPIARVTGETPVHPGTVTTVSGSDSFDPMGNYPLTYAWTLEVFPYFPGTSQTVLSDPTAVSPTLVPDLLGAFRVNLIVTNALGIPSEPATFAVQTWNASPIASAGRDVLLGSVPSVVTLDGSRSFDPDGDAMTYRWTVTAPTGSAAAPADPTSPVTSFTADVFGRYVAQLVVTDEFGAASGDHMVVGFDLPPVAVTDGDRAVAPGERVCVDASKSYDPNGGTLRFFWQFVAIPVESKAFLEGLKPGEKPFSVACFTADVTGAYVVGLTLSNASYKVEARVTVTAVATPEATAQELVTVTQLVAKLDPAALANDTLTTPLTAKLTAAIKMIEDGNFARALDKLENDVLPKMDGCASTGKPDRNDWVEDCEVQARLGTVVDRAVALLRDLIGTKPP